MRTFHISTGLSGMGIHVCRVRLCSRLPFGKFPRGMPPATPKATPRATSF
ncbi:hypothetical protein T07_9012 [Trichinella nelsoni]|uniref:Uncharacterized protein n=1 Tax=Trichinella nelsoni TaxID=6336 RepID=A0A0V0RBU1_9BILA|nr:hypothetical protein T07_9012 [Trichinella nelsoni]